MKKTLSMLLGLVYLMLIDTKSLLQRNSRLCITQYQIVGISAHLQCTIGTFLIPRFWEKFLT